jgi:hypothetical protein
MLRILGISKQGNLKAINKITTMIGSQTGRPVYFGKGKRRAATTITVTKYISQRTKYCSLANFSGNSVFMRVVHLTDD